MKPTLFNSLKLSFVKQGYHCFSFLIVEKAKLNKYMLVYQDTVFSLFFFAKWHLKFSGLFQKYINFLVCFRSISGVEAVSMISSWPWASLGKRALSGSRIQKAYGSP